MWKSALLAEASVARGEESGSGLSDLVKAYEMVKFEKVWKSGIKMKFPLGVLRLVLEAFEFTRVLKLGSALSEGILTLSAILAGGSFATD